MAPHSSTLAWKIPWTEEPGRLQSMGSQRVGHDWETSLSLFTFMLWKEMATHSSILAWRIPGTGEPGGLPSMELHRVGHDWSDLAAAADYRPTYCVDWNLRWGVCSQANQDTVSRKSGECMIVKSESEVAQSCLTLSDPMDCSLPGSSVHGIFQARVLEWGAIAFSTDHGLDFSFFL